MPASADRSVICRNPLRLDIRWNQERDSNIRAEALHCRESMNSQPLRLAESKQSTRSPAFTASFTANGLPGETPAGRFVFFRIPCSPRPRDAEHEQRCRLTSWPAHAGSCTDCGHPHSRASLPQAAVQPLSRHCCRLTSSLPMPAPARTASAPGSRASLPRAAGLGPPSRHCCADALPLSYRQWPYARPVPTG
ncbi:hypothetical protein PM3016_6618 [Paenibacillus mucilaginosus 3016]|uniref:Uncharacterized protein n=1 Tax=Paenibacillus mucilaginosus 3016 TaxID=1116391 RepID=H6NM71_9BACL|nr:hypothetical protein PM3016_6618 [Paenibacillus mucilaginosus 3016]